MARLRVLLEGAYRFTCWLPGSELGREVGVDLAAAADLDDFGCAPLLHDHLLGSPASAGGLLIAHMNATSTPKVARLPRSMANHEKARRRSVGQTGSAKAQELAQHHFIHRVRLGALRKHQRSHPQRRCGQSTHDCGAGLPAGLVAIKDQGHVPGPRRLE